MQDTDPTPEGLTLPLCFLSGSWGTDRHLLDRASGAEGRFTGTTVFTLDDGGLHWEEQGTVVWPSFRGPAARTYRVTSDSAEMLTVRFPDGRVLCTLDLRNATAQDEHLCGADTYSMAFTVPSPTTVQYSWDITGPAKDLLLTTVLTRR